MIGVFGSPNGCPWLVGGRDPLPPDFSTHDGIVVVGIPQANASFFFGHTSYGPFYQGPFAVCAYSPPKKVAM